jgi:hypothetical protein
MNHKAARQEANRKACKGNRYERQRREQRQRNGQRVGTN